MSPQKPPTKPTPPLAIEPRDDAGVLRNLPVGVFIHDGEHYLYCNPALATMWRLDSPEEVIGKTLLEFIHPDDREIVRERARLAIEQNLPAPPTRERIRCADGSEFIGEAATVPTRYQGRPAVLGIIRDVTPWAHAEERLRQLNQRLHTITHINQIILRVHESQQLQAEVCQALQEERGYLGVWIGTVDKAGASLQRTAVAGEVTPLEGFIPAQMLSIQASTLHRIALQEQQTVVKELTLRNAAKVWAAAIPIRSNEKMSSFLTAYAKGENIFNSEEILLLEELSGDLGLALERLNYEARQREAEQAMRGSEERFRALAEYSQVGIVLIQEQHLRYVNPALAKMFGYASPKEMMEYLRPLDIVAPESQEILARSIENQITDKIRAIRESFLGLRRDGSTFDVEMYGARILHANAPAVIATVVDITQQQQAWRQLEALSEAGLALSKARTSETALQQAVEQTLNIVPGDAANIFLIEGGALELVAHTGYDKLQVNVRLLLDAGIDVAGIPTFQEMLKTRRPLLIPDTRKSPLWTSHPEASPLRCYMGIPLIVRGEIIGFLSIDAQQPGKFSYQDTKRLGLFCDYVAATLEHLRLVNSLEEGHNQLALLYNLSHTLSETLELHQVAASALEHIGRTLGATRSILYLYDESQDTLTAIASQGLSESILPHLDEQLRIAPGKGLVGHVVRTRQTARVPDVTQNPHWVFIPDVDEWVHSALDIPLEAHGQVVGVLSLLSERADGFNVHDQQLVEALGVPIALALQNARFYEEAAQRATEMAEALRRQEDLDRMKDELIQNISHELRTPLALIMGYAELLGQGSLGPLAQEQTEAIEIITRRSHMLKSLVESITLLWQVNQRTTKEEPHPGEVFDLGEMARNVAEEFSQELNRAGIDLVCDITECALPIYSEPLKIRRVLDNLLGNALKFTPSGGQIQVVLQPKDNFAKLQVRDTGIGIPKDKLDKVFERFYQVDGSARRRYGGVGLGLALVQAIAEAYGGQVWAESPITDDPEHPGTAIIVQLPLAQA